MNRWLRGVLAAHPTPKHAASRQAAARTATTCTETLITSVSSAQTIAIYSSFERRLRRRAMYRTSNTIEIPPKIICVVVMNVRPFLSG
jgi:hypothetical protein